MLRFSDSVRARKTQAAREKRERQAAGQEEAPEQRGARLALEAAFVPVRSREAALEAVKTFAHPYSVKIRDTRLLIAKKRQMPAAMAGGVSTTVSCNDHMVCVLTPSGRSVRSSARDGAASGRRMSRREQAAANSADNTPCPFWVRIVQVSPVEFVVDYAKSTLTHNHAAAATTTTAAALAAAAVSQHYPELRLAVPARMRAFMRLPGSSADEKRLNALCTLRAPELGATYYDGCDDWGHRQRKWAREALDVGRSKRSEFAPTADKPCGSASGMLFTTALVDTLLTFSRCIDPAEVPYFAWWCRKYQARDSRAARIAHEAAERAKRTGPIRPSEVKPSSSSSSSPADAGCTMVLMRVGGTCDPLDLQRTLCYLHWAVGIFESAADIPGSEGDDDGGGQDTRRQQGASLGQLWRYHAIFRGGGRLDEDDNGCHPLSSSGQSPPLWGGGHCYLAIDKHALRRARLAMLRYIPVEYQLPQAPMLIQAWAMRSTDPRGYDLRFRGMMTVLVFLSQHLRGIGWKYTARKQQTVAFDTLAYGIYQIDDPGFRIYEYLADYVSLLRGDFDARLLIRIRESMPGAEQYLPRHWLDSVYSLVCAFVFQTQDHYIYKEMIERLWYYFSANPRARYFHPVVVALVTHYRRDPDSMPGRGGTEWYPMHVPSWDAVHFEDERDRPTGSAALLTPHHYVYMVCFDSVSPIQRDLQAELAHRVILSWHREEVPTPVFFAARSKSLSDAVFPAELRHYCLYFARSPSVAAYTHLHAACPLSDDDLARLFDPDIRRARDRADFLPWSVFMATLAPLGFLFSLLSSIQHLAWNPECAARAVEAARQVVEKRRQATPGGITEEQACSLVDVSGGGELHQIRGRIGMDDMHLFFTTHRDVAIAFDRQSLSMATAPAAAKDESIDNNNKKKKKKKKKKTEEDDEAAEGVDVVAGKKIFYFEHFLLSWPCMSHTAAVVDAATLDAYVLIRDPEFYWNRVEGDNPSEDQSSASIVLEDDDDDDDDDDEMVENDD